MPPSVPGVHRLWRIATLTRRLRLLGPLSCHFAAAAGRVTQAGRLRTGSLSSDSPAGLVRCAWRAVAGRLGDGMSPARQEMPLEQTKERPPEANALQPNRIAEPASTAKLIRPCRSEE